ncbi:PHB depolymerase family esterase [Polaromonas sp.]|uniref:extracellular catalytic domain type 1 short-chain-length polyhydroxyalkanoate depolymerase n=1 Tax=Polaromonas sp. TaxID=1869339 RepID=UPI00286A5BFE|nr:PHB depolymerase family esterase [Polaromonas sp.]
MNDTLQTLMREASRLTQAGRLTEATAAIQRALTGGAPETTGPRGPVAGPPDAGLILDGCVFEVRARPPATPFVVPATAPVRQTGQADFTSASHTHGGLTRRYKLYTPPGHAGKALPLVVMLHGCTQNPDDFAAGTGMNERAREQGFFVLYPEQPQGANPQRCWNWFKHNHQRRGSGEPALIADLTRAVIKQHGIDARRVYIAGLSAGGAMAAIVADAYPELFAAVGVHSGLPSGAARNMPEALALMRSGATGPGLRGQAGQFGAGSARIEKTSQQAVPTIVFHGDEDKTVHPRNGEQVIAAVLAGAVVGAAAGAAASQVEKGLSPNGRRYTRSTHRGGQGKVLAEHWLVHGAGHAWSGGHAAGSYTDAKGPDATREMLRFFFSHPH